MAVEKTREVKVRVPCQRCASEAEIVAEALDWDLNNTHLALRLCRACHARLVRLRAVTDRSRPLEQEDVRAYLQSEDERPKVVRLRKRQGQMVPVEMKG